MISSMNTFGRIFRIHIYGESHGEVVGLIVDGVRPGLPLGVSDFEPDLARRRAGKPGTTTRVESDVPLIRSGLFQGLTTGAPLCIEFANQNVKSQDYEHLLNQPRPGHADFTAAKKYGGFNDPRGGGHFSGRLTLCLVAAGVIAKKLLNNLSIEAKLTEIAGFPLLEDGLAYAEKIQDSVGGIVECRIQGSPIGWGEPFFDSVESNLAHILFSIPAVKGVEFGSGFTAARMTGSQHNDAILDESGRTITNHAGGINGGVTNGNDLLFRVAIKPASSTPQTQKTFHLGTGKMEDLTVSGRHDLCIALRVPVVVEAAAAICLLDLSMLHRAIES